jgi:hypothetical protein
VDGFIEALGLENSTFVIHDFKTGFRLFRTAGVGWIMIVPLNAFLKKLLPQAIVRDLRRGARSLQGAVPDLAQPQAPGVGATEAALHRDSGRDHLPGEGQWAESHLKNLKIVDVVLEASALHG